MAGNFNNMMKQVQAMQANMHKAQAEIASIEVIGEAGGGMVKITMSGRHEVKRVQIEAAVAAEDREMLQDLLVAAAKAWMVEMGASSRSAPPRSSSPAPCSSSSPRSST